MRLALAFFTLAAIAVAQCDMGNPPAQAEPTKAKGAPAKMTTATTTARGDFDIKMFPQKPDNPQETATGFGRLTSDRRLTSDKQFHGDLDATSQGVMLAHGTGAAGSSSAYVALEKVTGKLQGRTGTFILQHTGTMSKGDMSLTVTVVPDSGTGELAGLTGTMKIIIEGKKHSYEFEYALLTHPTK
jgi:hypothetical protein